MPHKYIYELNIIASKGCPGALEILTSFLTFNGVKASDVVEEVTDDCQSLKLYFSAKSKAEIIKKKIKLLDLSLIEASIIRILNKDWQTKWKEDFKPFKLTAKVWVVPSWYRNEKRYQKESSLFIDTSLAFGTGMHPTTQYMSEFIEEYRQHLGSFLDIGTGTGILSILALKYKAKRVEAIDISPDAIKIAKENCHANGFECKDVRCTDFVGYLPKRSFDFIAANLVTHDLVKFKRKIIKLLNLGGYLAISGVSIKHYSFFRGEFKSLPLRCVRVKKGNGWTAVLFTRF